MPMYSAYKGIQFTVFEMGVIENTAVCENGLLDFSVKNGGKPFFLARTRFGICLAQSAPAAECMAEDLIDENVK